jgi:hypothetical protein
MTPTECLREADVLDEIGAGRWPEAAPAALREHVAACPVCADLALVASGLQAEGAVARAELASIPLPSAGQVWWRAELRARQEKALLAQRPIAAVQIVAAVVLLLAIGSGLWALAPGAWAWFLGVVPSSRAAAADGLAGLRVLVAFGIVFCVVLASIAVVAVLRADRQADR